MAETSASRSKGKKLDSIISKLKFHTPVEEPPVPNEEKNENIESGEADVIARRSKRKPGKILRYKIDDDNDDFDEKWEEEKSQPANNSIEDITRLDDSLPKTIFEELPNGEAEFEEGEDTTVLFLPSEEIQVKAGPSEDYCHGLLDDQEEDLQEGAEEEEGRVKEKKKKKKKSKSYESDESLDEDGLPRRVICTACGRHVNPAHGTILRHPILNVLVCKKCNQYYNSGPFTRDEYGIEEQCRWCGDGGELICCDECEKVYCKPCIQRNCGKTYLKNLLNAPEDFKWLCIVCNKDKPLRHIQRLRKTCELVMEALDRIKAQKAHFKSKKGKQSSVVVGPTPLERRSRLTCLIEDIGIKGEGFSSSGESPTKKTFPKEDLPAELFSKTGSEEENEKEREELKEKKNEKDSRKDEAEETCKDAKEKENKMDEDVVDHSSSKEIAKEKKTTEVKDQDQEEMPAEIATVSQEEVEKQSKGRRSSRRLQISFQSVKSDETNEEETKSNASTSSKKEKAKAKSSDKEAVTGRRKTRSKKDGTVEPEGEIPGDELAVDQELFSTPGSEEENVNEREELKKKKNEKDSKKDEAEESGKDEEESKKENENKMDEDVVDHSSDKEKKTADVKDKGQEEMPAEIATVSQEEVEKQSKGRRSSRRLQISHESVKSDETNEEETKSNASTSSKKEKAKAKSSDKEAVTGGRKTVEPEGEIPGDELAVDQELFSKTEENKNEREELKKKKNEKDSKKDKAEESGKDEEESEKEKENKMDEDVVDHSSSKEIAKEKKTTEVKDQDQEEMPAEIATVSQEEVEKQSKRRRSSRRLQISHQSVKSDETNEEETKSNASTSSKKEKAKAKSFDKEAVTGGRKTRSKKDGTVEPKEGEIPGDELAVDQDQKEIEEDADGISEIRVTQSKNKAKNKEREISGEDLTANQEQEASDERAEKTSTIIEQTSVEVGEDDKSRPEKTRRKNDQNTEEELSDKDLIVEETLKYEEIENIQVSSSSSDVDQTKQKEKKKKAMMLTQVKQVNQEEQNSSEEFVTEKRPSHKRKENKNKVSKTKSGAIEKETTKNTAVKKEVIFIESSEEEEEKVIKQKGKGKKKGAKQEEDTTGKVSLTLSRGNKRKHNLRVKNEKDSSSDSESEKETKNRRKRKGKLESSEEEFVAEEPSEDEKEELTSDDSDSENDRAPLKKCKQTAGKNSKLRESSSELSPEKKKSRKTNVQKKKQLEESSESELDLSSSSRKLKLRESSESDGELKKKFRKTNVNKKKRRIEESSESEVGSEKEEDYILGESSESDTEKTSDESNEESDLDQDVKTRKRGLQKQTRKRPRPMESSSSDSDKQSSDGSDVGISRRTRNRRQEESDSSDVGTKKRTKRKGMKSQKEKGKNRKGKRRNNALDSDEDISEEESSENISESPSESEEEDYKPKSRRSKRQKKTLKKKKTNAAKKTATKSKKRRRIQNNSGSDEDEDQAEDKSPHKGRKKIRKLLADEKLGEETQKARRLEEERRKRLLERTRILESEEMPKESWRMNSLVLEKDEETKEPLVEVHPHIIQHLKPHQAKGIQFMYNNIVDTVKAYKKGDPGGGCILAHCMGLGKTLQVVGLIHTLINSDQLEFSTALVIAPLNTLLNWQVEFDKWLGVDDRLEVFVLKEAGANNWRRADMLKQWQRYGGVMIMGYDMYRNLAQCQRTKSKHQKKIFKQTLVDPGPDLVVCDEGHILRNDQSAISKTVNNIKTKRRIVLTGTPLQNNLIEYHCMMSFVKPNLLGTRREFMNTFGNPILNGQCADSTPTDVRLMKHRCHVLYKLLEGCVQRRDYSVLTPFLPPKHEYVLKIRLSETQRKLYHHYLNTFVCPDGDDAARRGASLFSDYQALMRIWTHPWCLKLEAIRRSLRETFEDTDDSLDGFVVYSDEEEEESEQSLSLSDESEEEPKKKDKSKKPFLLQSSSEEESEDNTSDEEVMPRPSTRRTARIQASTKTEETTEVMKVEVNGDDGTSTRTGSNTRSGANFKEEILPEKEWYDEFLTDEDEYNIELSGKMALLLEILADAEAVEEKVLVFSQSLVTLDLIERALGGGEVGGDRENWCRGCDYFRMDGSTSVQLRQRWSDIFNDVDNKTARLFLISTKAGGLGINLVAANRVIVFDVSWNPSHDVQSIFRVFRFGQTRPVYVYRLVTQGTMEEKIYERQVAKLSISERVIDKHQIERHFTAADLAELYTFNPVVYDEEKDKENLPKLPLPKDAVLVDLITRMHPKWIVKYHEHDSLLQNVEAEELTEEECQVAWSAYEAQKDQAKNQERVRALQAAYAQQQLQQQRQAIPQNVQNNNLLLREMQQLQQQQLSERMSRYQPNVRFQYVAPQNPMAQARTDQLRQQLLQHVGARHPVYQVHAQSGPSTAGPSYQPMMSYLSQQQQQHILGQRGPSNQVVQLSQSQPLSHPAPTAPPPMRALPPGAQYRR